MLKDEKNSLLKDALEVQESFVQDLLSVKHKYTLPVVMGLCSFSEVREFTYQELLQIRRMAIIKLEKELIYQSLSLLAYRMF